MELDILKLTYKKRRMYLATLFLLPVLIPLIVFTFIPLFSSISTSLHETVSANEEQLQYNAFHNPGDGVPEGQTFTVGFSGKINSIRVKIHNPIAPQKFTLTLYDGPDKKTVLEGMTRTIEKTEAPEDFVFAFRRPIEIEKGTLFYFEVVSEDNGFDFYYQDTDSYNNGVYYRAGTPISTADAYFKVKGQTTKFVGEKNYESLLTDRKFNNSVLATVYYMAGNVGLSVLISLIAALALYGLRGERTLMTLFLLPWMFSTMMAGLMFRWMFSSTSGIINGMLYSFGMIDGPMNWLQVWPQNMGVIIISGVWGACAFGSLVILAGLKRIPEALNESAKIDGAGTWRRFRHITFPFIKSHLIIFAILQTIWAGREFGLSYALTMGQPGYKTALLYFFVEQQGFKFHHFGIGAAAAFVTTLLITILIVIYIKVGRPTELFKL